MSILEYVDHNTQANVVPIDVLPPGFSEPIPYGTFVATLAKDMGPDSANFMHQAIGISGEAGEILDNIKKYWVYNKPMDMENLKIEIGDLLFYVTALMMLTGTSLHEVVGMNCVKLVKRYPGVRYSDEAAQLRADDSTVQNSSKDRLAGS